MAYPLEEQDMGQWCWAAVSLSVEKFFDASTTETQCSIASRVKAPLSCCTDRESCDSADQLQVALEAVKRHRNMLLRPLTFQEIQDEIRNGFPVCARIGWFVSGGHFVVITGYVITESGEEWVSVADPRFPNDSYLYDEFSSAYRGAGEWTHTYLVKK